MKLIAFVCGIILIPALTMTAVQFWRIEEAMRHAPPANGPFVRNNPQAKLNFLFVGDSTALGTGALKNTQSVAGWFGRDFPQARIDNQSANGKRIAKLVKEFPPYPGRRYDLIVIQIGANDILKFSSFSKVEKDLTALLKSAKTIGSHVVILHSGNVGLAPIFIWPFDWIMSERSRTIRALYMRKAKEEGVLYIDLFTERSNDLFLKDIPKYYSSDGLHPSGDGYRWWYQKIRWTMDQAGVVL